jgi:hypothetical protein
MNIGETDILVSLQPCTLFQCDYTLDRQKGKHIMSTATETTLKISFPRALLMSAFSMVVFVVGCWVIGIPTHDPLLIGFLVVMVIIMTPLFAAVVFFMTGCRISREGLCGATPRLYQRVLRWGDVTVVQKTFILSGPFYVVRGRGLGEFCILPRPFLLKHPDGLKQLIEQYAPADNILRRELAA